MMKHVLALASLLIATAAEPALAGNGNGNNNGNGNIGSGYGNGFGNASPGEAMGNGNGNGNGPLAPGAGGDLFLFPGPQDRLMLTVPSLPSSPPLSRQQQLRAPNWPSGQTPDGN